MGAYRTNRRDYSKPGNPKNDVTVSAVGQHGLTVSRRSEKTYWELIGPNLFEEVTGPCEGGPFERLEFYGPASDHRLSFATEPHVLYRLVRP
ncbi:hypothetical protein [Sphingomonas sp. CROZ-RG-20F-R02-07]|uniref:hypothetical protein n=1 Tax=Sphingomonas sp. CROZ-RG-20F-R02-07 TaxID=2914832 RepID=UPI001F55D057|nr:hypothetical protein [Sphingomonas sp. CROZ-RG-20F-R02-07]